MPSPTSESRTSRSRTSGSRTSRSRIAVIGAGITGITTAYQLAREGLDVTVIDRNRYAAMETSFANGGQLSASNAEVWNSWKNVVKGLQWLLRRDAPLAINPLPSFHKYSWLAEFISHIPDHDANTIETARLALLSRAEMNAISAEEGIEYDRLDEGILHFYESEADLQCARTTNRLLAKGGLERREVSVEELRRIEPTLSGHYVGGFYTEGDSTGDIHRFCTGLAAACEKKGVAMMMQTEVQTLRRTDHGVVVSAPGFEDAFDAVVICAGVRSRDLAAQLGERLNVYPVKGYSITVSLDDEESRAAAPQVSLLDDKAKIVTSRLGPDRFRVAGTAELAGMNRDIRAARIRPLTEWVERHFPGVSTEAVLPWAGLRPMLPSMMPRVGRAKRPSLYFNTGHGHLGWTLSAATSKIVARTIAEDFARS